MRTTRTPAQAASGTPVAVFDVSSLRLRFGPAGKHLSVLTTPGQHLATVSVKPSTPRDEAAWIAFADVLTNARVLLPTSAGTVVAHSVALYVPHTAQLSWTDPEGEPVVLAGHSFAVPPAGLSTRVQPAEGGPGWVMIEDESGTVRAASVDPDLDLVARSLSAFA